MYGFVDQNEWAKLHNFENVKDSIHAKVKSLLDRLEAYVKSDQLKEQFDITLDRSKFEIMPFESRFGKGRLLFSYSFQREMIEGKLIFQRQINNEKDERIWQPTLTLYFPPYDNPYAFVHGGGREVLAMDRANYTQDFERQCYAFLLSILYTQVEGPPTEKQG